MKSEADKKKFNDRWTVTEILGIVSILAILAGFVQHLVKGTEDRVITAIEKVDAKIQKVDNKIDKHIDFHLLNPLCEKNMEGSNDENFKEKNERSSGEKIYAQATGQTTTAETIEE